MNLEIGIETLLRKQRVESDRIEFKRGWNPDDIYMSICAFANDFDNVGGGYIVIGVEEKNGMAVRPVRGVDESELDGIQKDMVGFNHKIQPTYAAKVAIEKADGKTLVVLWVPTGMQRPYKTTEHVTSKKDNHYKYVIRYNSSSVVANPEQERELLAMTSWQAFDEQGNTEATLDDISPILLMEHLRVTGSRLAGQVTDRGVKEILEEMELLTGPPERQLLKNVALMMFCENPRKFFPDTQVEIVKFPRGAIKDPNNFIEVPPIRGSVPQIISRTMTTIKDMAIAERVEKVNYKMEANRYLSYPYAALEEVIVNAFYHRDYMCHQPVHVEIEPEFITVISYPGIDRSIPDEVIRKGERFRSRYYRNRRLGSFLKELDLCEGHCTAIPTIIVEGFFFLLLLQLIKQGRRLLRGNDSAEERRKDIPKKKGGS